MNPLADFQMQTTRWDLLNNSSRAVGAAALASLVNESATSAVAATDNGRGGLPGLPHFAPKAKRVIYLFMSGVPSHIDTWDYHPEVRELHGQELPESVRQGQRLTGMTSGQKSFPVVAPMFKFSRHGQN